MSKKVLFKVFILEMSENKYFKYYCLGISEEKLISRVFEYKERKLYIFID